MEKSTACHWQCTEIRRCKITHLPKGDINPELLEGVEFKLPDSSEGIWACLKTPADASAY